LGRVLEHGGRQDDWTGTCGSAQTSAMTLDFDFDLIYDNTGLWIYDGFCL
jgi:hypothetical protein